MAGNFIPSADAACATFAATLAAAIDAGDRGAGVSAEDIGGLSYLSCESLHIAPQDINVIGRAVSFNLSPGRVAGYETQRGDQKYKGNCLHIDTLTPLMSHSLILLQRRREVNRDEFYP